MTKSSWLVRRTFLRTESLSASLTVTATGERTVYDSWKFVHEFNEITKEEFEARLEKMRRHSRMREG